MNINSCRLIFIFNQSRLSEFECLNVPIYDLLIKSLNINLLPSDEVNECAKQICLYKTGTEVNAIAELVLIWLSCRDISYLEYI